MENLIVKAEFADAFPRARFYKGPTAKGQQLDKRSSAIGFETQDHAGGSLSSRHPARLDPDSPFEPASPVSGGIFFLVLVFGHDEAPVPFSCRRAPRLVPRSPLSRRPSPREEPTPPARPRAAS